MEDCIDLDDGPTPEPTPEPRPPRAFLRLPPAEPKRKKWEPRERDSFETLPRYVPEGESAISRTPPHSLEAEEYLLSCCFLDGADIVGKCIDGRIEEMAFYMPANRVIFNVLVGLYEKKRPIDLAVIAEELKTSRQLEEIGGYAYLTQISGRVPTTAQASYFIEKVHELYILRELIKAATGAVENCYDYSGGLSEFVEKVHSDIARITQDNASLSERLAFTRIRHRDQPTQARTIFSIAGRPVSTQGNLTAIIAQAKAGKTTLVGGALTAILSADGWCSQSADALGWTAAKTDGRIVLYFDTEQSPSDHWMAMDRVVRRANCETMPDNLWNYCVTGWQADEIRTAVRHSIESVLRQGNEIYAVVLDGVADLCGDVNDSEESNSLVSELHMLAIYAMTPIICVMHRNEGDKADSAARGHLGKQLARKAETNLRLEQKEGISFVFADRNRGAPIAQDEGPAFKWDAKSLMHKSIDAAEKAQFHQDHADDGKKPTRAKREPKPDQVKASDPKYSDAEVAALFPFGEKFAMPLPQIAKMAESRLLLPSRLFATYRFNLLTAGMIHMTSDGLYYR